MKTLRALELFSDYVNGEIVTLFTGNEITVPDADAEGLLASGRFEDVTPAANEATDAAAAIALETAAEDKADEAQEDAADDAPTPRKPKRKVKA